MKTTFSPDFIRTNKGCYSLEEVNALQGIEKEEISITEVLNSPIPLRDKIWFVYENCKLSLKEKQLLSLQFAKYSLKNYEALYPKDKRVIEAIQAAENCINNPTEENKQAAKSAAKSARSAARTAAESAALSVDESAAKSATWAVKSAALSAALSATWAVKSAARTATWAVKSAALSAAWTAAVPAARSAAQEQDLINILANFLK